MRAYEPITTATLNTIAADMGIRVEGTAQSFVLRPLSGSDEWRKIAPHSGRRVNAISWDGHYVFMERVLNVWPTGRIKSCLADYQGLADFKAKAPGTYTGQGFAA
jgi:hypothetical protein